MAHFKLNEDDDRFLQVPQDATLIFAGLGGTETWIERAEDQVVRIGVKSVGVATAGDAALEVCVEIGSDVAKGQDGPAAAETQLRAPARPCRRWSRPASGWPSRPIRTPPTRTCCAPLSGRPTCRRRARRTGTATRTGTDTEHRRPFLLSGD
jgi:hypothetical protein